MAKGEDGRKWKCKFYTPEARHPEALRRPHLALVGGGSKHSAGAKMQFWLTLAISCHKTDSAAGPSHSAGAKMQFWLTLAISCNCNTPSSHEVMAGRSASLGSVRTMPALGLQQRCVAAFRVAFLTTPARVPTPGLSGS